MKKLINEVDNVVPEQLEGMSLAHPELNFSHEPRFVWRENAGKVALLSGGGNGHEPLHTGVIGQGMLTGACPGEIFTSPTPESELYGAFRKAGEMAVANGDNAKEVINKAVLAAEAGVQGIKQYYTLPTGTRVTALEWSDKMKQASSSDRLYKNMMDLTKVLLLNGPQVGFVLYIRKMNMELL